MMSEPRHPLVPGLRQIRNNPTTHDRLLLRDYMFVHLHWRRGGSPAGCPRHMRPPRAYTFGFPNQKVRDATPQIYAHITREAMGRIKSPLDNIRLWDGMM